MGAHNVFLWWTIGHGFQQMRPTNMEGQLSTETSVGNKKPAQQFGECLANEWEMARGIYTCAGLHPRGHRSSSSMDAAARLSLSEQQKHLSSVGGHHQEVGERVSVASTLAGK
jgi:hypothetical protein